MKNNNQNNHGLNECKGKDKFKKFRTITGNILKAKGHKELIKSGCSVPQCQQRSWEIRFKTKDEARSGTAGGFQCIMPENTKVLFRKEIRLYTLLNFFAEVGGYLGLLLGESLLSYIIAASNWILIFCKKITSKI